MNTLNIVFEGLGKHTGETKITSRKKRIKTVHILPLRRRFCRQDVFTVVKCFSNNSTGAEGGAFGNGAFDFLFSLGAAETGGDIVSG